MQLVWMLNMARRPLDRGIRQCMPLSLSHDIFFSNLYSNVFAANVLTSKLIYSFIVTIALISWKFRRKLVFPLLIPLYHRTIVPPPLHCITAPLYYHHTIVPLQHCTITAPLYHHYSDSIGRPLHCTTMAKNVDCTL